VPYSDRAQTPRIDGVAVSDEGGKLAHGIEDVMTSDVGGEVDTEAPPVEELEEPLEEPEDEELLEEEGLEIDDLVAEDLVEADEDALEETAVVEDEADAEPAVATVVEEPLTEIEDDDEDCDDDDVEASLDVILKERLVVADEAEDEEDAEPTDAEDRADGAMRVLPKQPGEFVCQSCFLVKSQTQLADRRRKLCRDCV
jgi:Domain of unknown function (DUF4193)